MRRYAVTRTFLNKVGDKRILVPDRSAQLVEARSAVEAASKFIADETCQLVGEIQALSGDEATAFCQSHGQTYVIMAARADP